MCNMLNVKYRYVDKQEIKHFTLLAQVTFLFSFTISFLFLNNVEVQRDISTRFTCYLYSSSVSD